MSKKTDGYLLVEVLISISLLAIAVTAMCEAFAASRAAEKRHAAARAAAMCEEEKNLQRLIGLQAPMSRCSGGFSLVELIIALALLALLALHSHQILNVSSLRLGKIQSSAAAAAEMGTALSLIKKDLRCAYLTNDPEETFFFGRSITGQSQIEFTRTASSDDSQTPVKITYALELNSNGQGWDLWRQADGKKILLCAALSGFELRYFSGGQWQEAWGWNAAESRPFQNMRGLPLVVSVRLRRFGEEATQAQENMLVPIMTPLLNETLRV